MSRAKLAVLISGRGTNLQALIDAAAAPDYPAEIALVVSNRPNAQGLERAAGAGLNTATIDHKAYDSRAAFDAALSERLRQAEIDLICLAGFMRKLTDEFVGDWQGKLINIHPSLLPAFKGLDVHERMIEAGVKVAGCTVHFVSAELDSGPIIGQAAAPVLAGDDADTLAARILKLEHQLYPECVRLLVEQKATLDGGRVRLLVDPDQRAALVNPKTSNA